MEGGHDYPVGTETSTAPQQNTSWMHRHPYVVYAIGAAGLLLIMALIVNARSSVSGSSTGGNWVLNAGIFTNQGSTRSSNTSTNADERLRAQSPDSLSAIPITQKPSESGSQTEFEGDLSDLLALLAKPVTSTSSAGISTETPSAFSFIPQGLISLPTLSTKLSPTAEKLHSYGNDIGTYIQAYDSEHSQAIQILKDQAEDRTNTEKATKVTRLAFDMAALGRDLIEMENVPKEMQSAHLALGTAFRIAGTNLSKIPDAKTDEAFIDAITTYNASVEELGKRFVAMSTLFSAYGVRFSSSEPGSIFMFSPIAGL